MAGAATTKSSKDSARAPMTITGDAIHAETIRKELQNFTLNDKFILSPTAIKNLVLTNKPNSIANLQTAKLPEGDSFFFLDPRSYSHSLSLSHSHSLSLSHSHSLSLSHSHSDSHFEREVHLKPAVVVHSPFEVPVTTGNTYGWDTVPLLRITDRRFYHPKVVTEITKMYGTTLVKEKKKEA